MLKSGTPNVKWRNSNNERISQMVPQMARKTPNVQKDQPQCKEEIQMYQENVKCQKEHLK
jgi:hypothetical protein